MNLKSLLILTVLAPVFSCTGAFSVQASDGSAVEIFTFDEASPNFQPEEKTELYEASAGFRPYYFLADKAVVALIEGKDDVFFDMTSQNLITHFTKEKVQKNVKTSLLPFFEGFQAFNEDLDVAPTTDSWGSNGYSFYQSFKNMSGETKYFLVQVVVEDGKMMIANLTPDAKTPYDKQ